MARILDVNIYNKKIDVCVKLQLQLHTHLILCYKTRQIYFSDVTLECVQTSQSS